MSSRQVTATLHSPSGELAPPADIQHISLRQYLFSHHVFEVIVPFDNVEGPQTGFLSQAPKQLLGQPLSMQTQADMFHFNSGQTLGFSGLITHLSTSKDNDYAGSILVRGFSPCYLLTDGLKKRTFVGQTLAAIFQKVLEPYPNNLLKREINPVHQAPLAYVTQYNESNFAFLNRLAAEYGEWFYFDGKKLRLGTPSAGKEIKFVADGIHNRFSFGMNLKPALVKLYEYDYQQHKHYTSSTGQHRIPAIQNHPFGRLALAQSEQLFTDEMHMPAEAFIRSPAEPDEEAKLLKANAMGDLITFEGTSDNPDVSLGCVLEVSGEGIGSRTIAPDSFGKYRVIAITHRVDAAGNYSNEFTAIPNALDIPPANLNYDPPHGSPELAEVIDDRDPLKLVG